MRLSVVHSTIYRYAEPVSRSTQYIRLTPYASSSQRTLRWDLRLPEPAVALQDAFGNLMHVLTLDSPHDAIRIVATGEVDVDPRSEGEPVGPIEPGVYLRSTPLTAADDALRAFAEPLRATVDSRPMSTATELMGAVLEALPYRKGLTSSSFSAAQSFATRGGVCQDHAHVFVCCCRLLGLPARYVSGYVYSSDFEQIASHAWAEAWIDDRWRSFDVTNARSAGGAHVKLAIGLDYLDACPVRGVRLGGGEENLRTIARVKPAGHADE